MICKNCKPAEAGTNFQGREERYFFTPLDIYTLEDLKWDKFYILFIYYFLIFYIYNL